MRLRHIELFEAIRRTGSLTQAAELLHISQPAASKLLASAEHQLGFKLFERVKGRLIPTPEALELAPHIADLYDELGTIQRLANNLKYGQTSLLKIGCTPALGLSLLPQAIQTLKQQHSHVHCEISTQHGNQLINALMTHELDFVICFHHQHYPGIQQTTIGHTELVYISQNAHASSIRLMDIPHDHFIALEANDPVGQQFQDHLLQQGIALNVNTQVQTHYVAHALVEAGCGNAVIDALTANALQRPTVYTHRIDPTIVIPINILTRTEDALSKIYQDFQTILANLCNGNL